MANDEAHVASFAHLDDLVLFHVLNFVGTEDLLRCALLSSTVRDVARGDDLWAPRLGALCSAKPLGYPAPMDGVNSGELRSTASRNSSRTLQLPFLHPMARLSEAALLKLPVKQLKALASSLDVDARALVSCSEKSEICQLIAQKQLALLHVLQNCCRCERARSKLALVREWHHAGFAAFWCGRADLNRDVLLRHELVAPRASWALHWRPEAVGHPGDARFGFWHTTMRFQPSGEYDSDAPDLNNMNANQRWELAYLTDAHDNATPNDAAGCLVKSPHDMYPPMRVSRTPLGGWQLSNIHVIMLSHAASSSPTKAAASALGETETNTNPPPPVCEQHFGKDAMKLL